MTVGPSRDSRPGIREIFLDSADSCERLGAPTYAEFARCVAEWCDDEPLLSLLAPHADARVGDMIPLRLFAAVHRLALERRAGEVALSLATLGGTPPRGEADRQRLRSAFLATLDRHRDDVATALARIPQTNEVGRTVGLAALLRRVHREFGLPVRLHEIGCSAGLSLGVDELVAAGVIDADHVAWGPLPAIIERVGSDVAPVDALSQEGRLLLSSFVWPDHPERFERLRRALAVAAHVRARVVAQEAIDHLRSLTLRPGTTLVVWHSAMWLYQAPRERDHLRAAIDRLGAAATRQTPVVHIGLEPVSEVERHRFTLTMTAWPGIDGLPGGVEVPWGSAPPAGEPVDWSVPCAGGIVRDGEGHLLLVRRGREPARGLWSIPGGRVEGQESWAEAAIREVREETGIEAADPEFVGFVERDSGAGTTYLIADFALTGAGLPSAADDADDARWCDVDDIRLLETSPGLDEALRGWGMLD